jgi:UDP-N-acetylmuramyl pentapeptide phosphotransferase/UDP-N-acetylglucosamine-1-phosphate transferase
VRPLIAGALAGALSAVALDRLRRRPPGGAARWDRTNHAGRTVSLLEGPAYAAGAACATGLVRGGRAPLLATVAAAGLGALDDLRGDAGSKGLRGHLGALARGEVTTGAVKVVGLGLTGLATAHLLDAPRRRAGGPQAPTVADTVVAGAVVAGAANLLNLLDLRPGRALKVTAAWGLLGAVRRPPTSPATSASAVASAAAAGAAFGLLRPDLAGETMLGDTGANSAGALLGTALVQRTGRRGRWVALVVLSGLTLLSEKVSFTRVIESTPGLRELDAWGRP